MRAPLLGSAPRTRGPIVVIGGGVSGLASAYFLRQAGDRETHVLEAGERFGGNIRTERWGDFLIDAGPDSFMRARPEGVALCRELGLADELLTPRTEARGVYIARDGRLERMPEGLSLGVPMSIGALLDCPSLSPLGKARAFLEPFIKARQNGQEESVRAFLRRRLGAEVADRLAAPLLSGVFAGNADRLSIDAAFPQLVELERRHGSLVRGMLRGRSWTALLQHQPSDSPFTTPRRGLGQLIETLVDALPAETLSLRTRVRSLAWDGERYHVETDDEVRSASAVVLALPPWRAAELMSSSADSSGATTLRALGEELGEVRSSATATVFYAFDGEDVEHSLDASGFIVPDGEGRILASTWVSSKWDHRAPPGKALIRVFVGGARNPERLQQTDAELVALGLGELRRFMGSLGTPRWARVYRYRRGNPQPELGQLARLERVRDILQGLPGLILVGAGYGGVGIPDCVRQAREAAQVLLEGGPAAGSHSGVV